MLWLPPNRLTEAIAVVIIGQALTDADLEALDHVLDTFNLVGTLLP